MDERFIEDLLDELDKAGKLTMLQLEEKGIPRDLILKALNRDLIRSVGEPEKAQNDRNFRTYIEPEDGVPLFLTITGFELLNQIRIKNAIEKFNESSDKYSKKIIELTFAVYVFTIIVATTPLIEKILQLRNSNDPLNWILLYLLFLIAIAGTMIIYYKIWYEKRA
jgi:hypothetical protein